MTDMSPAALLKHVRATSGEAALRNLTPIILSIGLADGVHPDDPELNYTPSMTVSPMVHPTLAALLDFHGATRRGRATWQVGLGRHTPTTAVTALLRAAYPGTVLWKQTLLHRNKPREIGDIRSHEPRMAWNNNREATLACALSDENMRLHYSHSPYLGWSTQDVRAQFGVVALNHRPGNLWISVHSTSRLELPESLADEIGEIPLNLWQVGRNFRDPVRVYPAQALAIAEWASSRGIPIWDPSGTGALTKFMAHAKGSVVAWPRRGRPAQATVSVGNAAPAEVVKTLLGKAPRDGERTSHIVNTDSQALAKVLSGASRFETFVDPAVLDAAALAAAKPIDDPALRPYQQVAVARHLATSVGYVNACSPGLGKTIMVLDAMRRRAATIPAYRGLAVVEANVREQWVTEAERWFPGAQTVCVATHQDAKRLEQVLAEAGAFPVLVVTSYSLASDVAAHISDVVDEPSDVGEANLTDADLDVDEALPAPPAAVEAEEFTPEPVLAPAVHTRREVARELETEPDDLLQLLAVILADGDRELEEITSEDVADTPLGKVLLSQSWHDLIADEAVMLRTTSSKQSKAMWALRMQSQVAVALTGTPISRGINDLGALVAWVRADRRLFHGSSLESQFDISNDAELEDFSQALGAILFRRDKSEISSELPNSDPQVVTLEPSAPERALANAAQNELKRAYDDLMSWLDQVSREHEGSDEYAAAKAALAAARHAWLGGTTLARMATSDPATLLTAKGAGAALLASQGLVAAATAQPGTKRTAVVKDAVKRIGNGERLLIFTEFASAARGLIDDLDAAGVRVGAVVGGGGRKRDRQVREFRAGMLDVLVCTTAGERGLNLQTATTIVHFDLPWTPEGIIQRTGRVERIGATASDIKIVFPILAGTIEERVASIVVARAATMMRALDSSRGIDARTTDVGRALGTLASVAKDDEVSTKEAALLQITRELLAA